MKDYAIGTLDLAFSLGVGDCRPIHMDMVMVTEVQELLAHELCTIVGDDNIGNPKMINDVGEEQDGLLGVDVVDGSSLNPLAELVDGNE